VCVSLSAATLPVALASNVSPSRPTTFDGWTRSQPGAVPDDLVPVGSSTGGEALQPARNPPSSSSPIARCMAQTLAAPEGRRRGCSG
jgi:hypothetical protein